jgi:metallo-beta-lactamase class B
VYYFADPFLTADCSACDERLRVVVWRPGEAKCFATRVDASLAEPQAPNANEERTMQILPNVYLVNGFPYAQHQNGYVLRLGDALVMVDSGDLEAETFPLVERNCARWGFAPAEISHLLLTHAHFDHSSHAARLKRSGVCIVANRDCADALATGDDRCIGYAVHRIFEPCTVDRIVEDGEELVIGGTAIRCLAAPGHANSCTIYEVLMGGERLWFVGDVIKVGLECATVELGWGGGPDYHRSTYLQTLRKLCHLECDHLFPGHGPACLGGGQRLLEMAYTKAMLESR